MTRINENTDLASSVTAKEIERAERHKRPKMLHGQYYAGLRYRSNRAMVLAAAQALVDDLMDHMPDWYIVVNFVYAEPCGKIVWNLASHDLPALPIPVEVPKAKGNA